jgi:predicted phosphodiesterase
VRTALFSDVHGNAVAFDALLADLGRLPVEQLVCLGDAIQGGPQPAECIDRLRALGCPIVLGNADWEMLTLETELEEWTRAQLSADDLQFVRSFAPTIQLPGILAFHGSPRSFEDRILPWTPEDEFRELLAGADAAVLTGGHTHLQFLRRRDESVFVNPGSVGLAYAYHQPEETFRFDPWAEYAVVSNEDGVFSLEFRRVPFDPAEVVRAFETSGNPAQDRARGWR